jgi:hypothetical protein
MNHGWMSQVKAIQMRLNKRLLVQVFIIKGDGLSQ